MTSEHQFYVGEKLRVVKFPVKCAWHWVYPMARFCGKTVTVASATHRQDGWIIRIEEDGSCAWCENCFEEPDSPVAIPTDHLNSLL